MKPTSLMPALLSAALPLASCGVATTGEIAPSPSAATVAQEDDEVRFTREEIGRFDEPWAAAFAPGTQVLFVTEKEGTIRFLDMAAGRLGAVTGAPEVDYGGQGGLGDIAFLAGETSPTLSRRTIYLSWAEAGDGDTRGAVVGKGTLVCEETDACRIDGLEVIWRQSPKVTGRGHYSHRLAISPDGQYLFVASGDRQKGEPAQDTGNNLGSIVRLTLDGAPAPGNPLAGQAGKAQDIWSWGHRNTLGLHFDAAGRLWNLEHGPAGGDELNLIQKGRNYGWPLVSGGDHYDGRPIPANATRPDLAAPAVNWTPVIAPGDFVLVSGTMFPAMKGHALIAGLKEKALVDVAVEGDTAREIARYPIGFRVREIVEAPDGALVIFEDGGAGRALRLTPG